MAEGLGPAHSPLSGTRACDSKSFSYVLDARREERRQVPDPPVHGGRQQQAEPVGDRLVRIAYDDAAEERRLDPRLPRGGLECLLGVEPESNRSRSRTGVEPESP